MSDNFWKIPVDEWKDEPCFIIGGGFTLKEFDCTKLKDKGRVIAVNCAGSTVAKWANILYWSDHRWYEWNRTAVTKFKGIKVTRIRADNPHVKNHYEGIKDINVLKFKPSIYVSEKPEVLGGFCSGSSALNIAWLMGANPIYLLAFDMKQDSKGKANYHDLHKVATSKDRYKKRFLPVFEQMARILKDKPVEIFTVSTDTALRCFPILTYKELEAKLDGQPIEINKTLQRAENLIRTYEEKLYKYEAKEKKTERQKLRFELCKVTVDVLRDLTKDLNNVSKTN